MKLELKLELGPMEIYIKKKYKNRFININTLSLPLSQRMRYTTNCQ